MPGTCAGRAHRRAWWIDPAGARGRQRAFRRFPRYMVGILAELAPTLSLMQWARLGRGLRDPAAVLEAVERDARRAMADAG